MAVAHMYMPLVTNGVRKLLPKIFMLIANNILVWLVVKYYLFSVTKPPTSKIGKERGVAGVMKELILEKTLKVYISIL
jgi:hypothetical protein